MVKKNCKECGKLFIPYSSVANYCSYQCYNKNKKPAKGTRKRIKPISDKRAEELKEYRRVRDVYKCKHPKCERCGNDASEIHHKNGRNGARLVDDEYFMSVCRKCHNWIHANPEKARELKYLI